MYKFLLVDDETIIREGISQIIEWDSLGIELLQAKDGYEAYSIIEEVHPDAIITDIKMPGMDGLELIKTVKDAYPDTEFVILSGYGEFNYANRAMQYGVKYYLLKPSDEDEITSVIKQVIDEIKEKREKDNLVKTIQQDLLKVLPQVKEQFLREYVMNISYNREETQNTLRLLSLSVNRVIIVLIKTNENLEFKEKVVLKNLSEKLFQQSIIFSTILEDYVLIMTNPIDEDQLVNCIMNIRKSFYNYYGVYLTAAVSEEDDFEKSPYLYQNAKKYLKYSFYLPEHSIITQKDIVLNQNTSDVTFRFNYEQISFTVKSGNYTEMVTLIQSYFEQLKLLKLEVNIAKSYFLELFMCILRQAEPKKINYYINKSEELENLENIQQIYDFILEQASEITKNNYEMNIKKHNTIINSILTYTDENIANEELSLSMLAQKILYMNVDYVGKLFKKKTGESFSNYLLLKRIAKAKELIIEQYDFKVYQIAEQVGFGNNPQYFSQVFKKVTGYSPSEYKKVYNKT